MARRNKINTKLEIIEIATAQFLENGYTETRLPSIAKELGISLGNLTFHFPTKEHLLAEFIKGLCDFQWELMAKVTHEGKSSLLAYALELATIISVSETNHIIKDIYISAYTHPMSLRIIRENDAIKMMNMFGEYCPEWTEQEFRQAEAIVSGIEYGTIAREHIDDIPLDDRIAYALDSIMKVFNMPEDKRSAKIHKILSMDYEKLGKDIVKDFYRYIIDTNAKALQDALENK